MKKLCMILFCCIFCLNLAACGGTTTTPTASPEPVVSASPENVPTEDQFVFTRENFPRLDGSTSLVPLAEAVAAVLLGESREEASDLISFNRTTQSYRNLMWDSCDLIIAATPADTIYDEYALHRFEYDMARIASDALVFVVSADNPVDSLTVDQIQRIYTGEITNWSEVGGNDVEIIPFQRNSEAGSQTAMLRLVMDGLEIMDPPSEYIIESMAGLMEAVRNFDGSEGAIGYSVYYYANDMRMAEGLKILSVEGVQPEPSTIADQSYPFLAAYYTVIAASQPEDSPARILYNWLQSEEGQRLIESQSYVPVMTFGEASS